MNLSKFLARLSGFHFPQEKYQRGVKPGSVCAPNGYCEKLLEIYVISRRIWRRLVPSDSWLALRGMAPDPTSNLSQDYAPYAREALTLLHDFMLS